jgi:predicted nucleic acid-binding protein
VAFERVYLDTNVIVRAFEPLPDDTTGHDIFDMLGILRPGSGPRFVTSHISLAEVLVHPIRNGHTDQRQEYLQLLSNSSAWLQVRPVDQSVLVRAAELRATTRLKLPDAIHFATAMLTGCSHLLSSDADFHSRSDTPDPHTPVVVRPTREVVDEITAWLRA